MSIATLTLASLVLSAQAQDPAPPELSRVPATCDTELDTFDPLSVHHSGPNAPANSAWWLSRERGGPTVETLLDELDLVVTDADGQPVEATIHRTANVVAVVVPEGASAGDMFFLGSPSLDATQPLQVTAASVPPSAVLEDVSIAAAFPPRESCTVDCYSGDELMPVAPALTVSISSGEAIVDAWFASFTGDPDLYVERLIDSRLVRPTDPSSAAQDGGPAAADGMLVNIFEAWTYQDAFSVFVEVRDAHSLAVLYSARVESDGFGLTSYEPTEDEQVSSCDIQPVAGDCFDYDNCLDEGLNNYPGCSSSGANEFSWLFVGSLLGLARRRRRPTLTDRSAGRPTR